MTYLELNELKVGGIYVAECFENRNWDSVFLCNQLIINKHKVGLDSRLYINNETFEFKINISYWISENVESKKIQFRLPTEFELKWYEQCVLEGKYVPKEKIKINSEINLIL